MRILRLSLCNLNSLAGKWEIDFTAPEYVSDGIFAITGPTGAGKTTILDAICLALYGRTPRLPNLSKSGNEIMSRKTGVCWAEVTFSMQGRSYTCHWSQRRAREKPGGALQDPQRELADAESGTILASKIRDVTERLEAITGMDFQRFTRTIMLAQGQFAAFLQAGPDERSPILEQITGTGIYSDISKKIHERRVLEGQRLEALKTELEGLSLLPEERRQELDASLETLLVREKATEQEARSEEAALRLLDTVADLRGRLLDMEVRQQAWEEQRLAFVPRRERLERAVKALELSETHTVLSSLRAAQKAEEEQARHGQILLPSLQEEAKRAEQACRTLEAQLTAVKANNKELAAMLKKVRELDLAAGHQMAILKSAEASLAETEREAKRQAEQLRADNERVNDARQKRETLLLRLAETGQDAGLVEALSGITGEYAHLREREARAFAAREALKTATAEAEAASETWKSAQTLLKKQSADLEDLNRTLNGQEAELDAALQRQPFSFWRERLAALGQEKNTLDKARDLLRRLEKEILPRADAIRERQVELVRGKSALTREMAELQTSMTALEQTAQTLEAQWRSARAIQDYADARTALQENHPCPLCGSIHHPYAEHLPCDDPGTERQLEEARAKLKACAASITQTTVLEARLDKDMEQAQTAALELDGERERLEGDIQALLAAMPVPRELPPAGQSTVPMLGAFLERTLETVNQEHTRTGQLLGRAEQLEQEAARSRTTVRERQEALLSTERGTQTAVLQKEKLEERVRSLEQEALALDRETRDGLESLKAGLAGHGLEILSPADLPHALEELTKRRDAWVASQEEKSALDRAILELETRTRHLVEEHRRTETEAARQRAAFTQLKQAMLSLRDERNRLFGEKDPDQEEIRAEEAVRDVETSLEQTGAVRLEADRAVDRQTTLLARLRASLESREETLNHGARDFSARLQDAGFAHEAEYLAACLPEEERASLTREAQALDSRGAELEGMRRETKALLATQEAKGLPEKSRAELAESLAALHERQRALQQEIGGIRRILADNDTVRREQQEKLTALEGRKREYTRWSQLHDLIGSHDGKKFRNFAQGLTLDSLLAHANRQLERMTDRYLLTRDSPQSLELSVLDSWQAGEVRSTKNLSGGESFLVSLALALGLSRMAGASVRVDSLFLDEGFGALDEDTLDLALDALAGLHLDGKVIGIISHVPALRDRITTRIDVTPMTEGRSALSGPGCSGGA